MANFSLKFVVCLVTASLLVSCFPAPPDPSSEGKFNVDLITRHQQAYYIEEGKFPPDIPSLVISIETETSKYKYSTQSLGKGTLQTVGLAKVEGLKSYTGIVRAQGIAYQASTSSVLCESDRPTTALPLKLSKEEINNLSCPVGYSVIDKTSYPPVDK